MRSWMIGVISGILPVGLFATLPALAYVPFLLVVALLLLVVKGGQLSQFGSGLILGLAVALMHGHQLLERRPEAGCEGVMSRMEGVVASLPRVSTLRNGDKRQRFEFRIEAIAPQACARVQTVLLSYYGSTSINPGERWRFSGRLKRPWGLANPGSFNIQSWYAQTGIDALGNVAGKRATRLQAREGLAYIHHSLRQAVSRELAQLPLAESSRAILQALTVADKSGLDRPLWALFQQYGVNHLLVISGLHIGLVAALGMVLGTGLSRIALLLGGYRVAPLLPGALALLLAVAYTALAGFSLSTNRALLMLLSFVLASLLNRTSSKWNSFLLAAVVVLVFQPLAGLGSGFWLSFGAVAFLLWFGTWQQSGGRVLRAVMTHGCMALFMIPIGGWWFGGASLVSGIANFIMVPLVGLLIVPLSLLGIALVPLFPQAAQIVLLVAAWPLEQIVPLAKALSTGIDVNLLWQYSPSLVAVVLAVLGLGLGVTGLRLRTITLALVLCVPLLVPVGRSLQDEKYLAKLTVLDVGQGTAVVLQDAERTLVYDTGGGDPAGSNMASTVILPYLRLEGISSLDTLIVSHADSDHSAGAATLAGSMAVKRYLSSGEFLGSDSSAPCRTGQAWRWPSGISFQIMSPAGEQGLSSNNSSCVLRIQTPALGLLLPGDIDHHREKTLVRYWRDQLGSDWLLAGHHGSITSTSFAWLKYVQPSTVVFSSGYANPFGHPHPEIARRLTTQGRQAETTSKEGALEYYLNAEGVSRVEHYRREHKRYWH
ncbi:MAG: DNA internalization-related competence protein ComEC/Rec2 [Halioglobus sp.]